MQFKKFVNWQHNLFTWAWILRMFYISGTTFTLFQQDLIFSSLGSPIWNCPTLLLSKKVPSYLANTSTVATIFFNVLNVTTEVLEFIHRWPKRHDFWHNMATTWCLHDLCVRPKIHGTKPFIQFGYKWSNHIPAISPQWSAKHDKFVKFILTLKWKTMLVLQDNRVLEMFSIIITQLLLYKPYKRHRHSCIMLSLGKFFKLYVGESNMYTLSKHTGYNYEIQN